MQTFSCFFTSGRATPLCWLLKLQIGFRDDEELREELALAIALLRIIFTF